MTNAEQRMIALGRLGRAKGLKGELYMDVYNPDSTLLFGITEVTVGSTETETHKLEIDQLKPGSNRWVVSFKTVLNREQAESLTNLYVYAPRHELPELPHGQYYHCDILGFDVIERVTSRQLGKLERILVTDSNEVYVVKGPEEVYLPNIPGVVEEVNLENRSILVRLPEYLDAN